MSKKTRFFEHVIFGALNNLLFFRESERRLTGHENILLGVKEFGSKKKYYCCPNLSSVDSN